MRIDFRGYAGDCTILGQIETDSARLSDALDRADEVVIHDATLHSLAGEQAMYTGEMVLKRDDLFAIEALTPPPGNDQRRVRMVRHALRARLGPYTCFGELHALPGVPPLRTLLVRRTMIPLTNCLVHFRRGGQDEFRRAPLMIHNGRLIEHVELATAEQLENELAALAGEETFGRPAQLA
jgi:hypothetical protein